MRRVEEILSRNARDGAVLFVFPSEVAARFWQRRALALTGLSAFRTDRIISWDTFKERVFPGPGDLRPVNTALRVFFVRELLRKNREAPFLRRLVRPGFSEVSPAFSGSIRQILPQLRRVLDAAEKTGCPLEEDLLRDLSLLRSLYGEFLASGNLYEPAFQEKAPPRFDGRAFLFFPEVLDDFGEYRPVLEGSRQVLPVPAPEGETPFLEEYGNGFQEVRGLMTRLAALLDSGVPPEEIVVSVPGLDEVREDLEEQAGLQGVPIRIRGGRKLTESPGGAFFAAAAGVVSSGFSVEALKALLLNGAFPWKEEDLIRRVILLGIARSCHGAYSGPGGRVDPWEEALRAADRESRTFLRELVRSLQRLLNAPDFEEIRMRTQAFASAFFDPDGWKPEPLRVFQYALRVLAELAELEKRAGFSVAEPFGALTEVLDETIYVSPPEAGGVDIYPYRVTAGIFPSRHFIINAGHESTETGDRSLAFLREDEKEALGLSPAEVGDLLLSLYTASGDRVFFSFAGETRRGMALPAGFFVTREKVRKTPGLEEERRADASLRERAYWSGHGENPFPAGPLPIQKEGFRRYTLASGAKRGLDAGREILPARTAAGLLTERVFRDGKVRLSPSSLQIFAHCPFRFLLECCLGLEESRLDAVGDDPRMEGILYHEAFRELAREISRRDGPFRGENREAYRALVPAIVKGTLDGLPGKETWPLSPLRRAWAERMTEDLWWFLDREAEEFDGHETRKTEFSLSCDLEGAEAVLTGRLDRVSGVPGDAACQVVDYKTGGLPTGPELRGEKDVPSVQIPSYVYLLEKSGFPVDRALYYSVKEGRYRAAYAAAGKADLGPEEMRKVLETLLRLGASAADRIRGGDYRFYPEDCEPCAFRGLCRRKYLIERRGPR